MYYLSERNTVDFCPEPFEKYNSKKTPKKPESLHTPFQGRDLCIVRNYAGISLGGIHPTNAFKKNQDSLIMAEDFTTRSLMFVCLDGHGANGDKISQFVKSELETRLFCHELFMDDVKGAIRQVLYELEKKLSLLEGRCGEFSGTTLSMAIIRGNMLITANVGDSRIVLAKHAPDNNELLNFRRRSRTDSWSTTGGSFDSLVSHGETDLEQLSLTSNEFSPKSSPDCSGILAPLSSKTHRSKTHPSSHSSKEAFVLESQLPLPISNGTSLKGEREGIAEMAPLASPVGMQALSPTLPCSEDDLSDALTMTTVESALRNSASSTNSSASNSTLSTVPPPPGTHGVGFGPAVSPCSDLRKRSRSNLSAEGLTIDHKPDLLQEYNRITNAGGRVFSVRYADGVVGPPRVWLGQSNVPGLAMSRSIGDFVVHTAGVVSTPDITEQELDYDADCMLIIATDGIWDQMSNHEAVNVAAAHTHADEAAAALVDVARSRWLEREKNNMDDITACVVFLQGM